ncbi:hypothetical protein AXG93_3884s1520 [Marchantia polymorpha subsp. ruderalis]|uniref:Uncharacterized protein n=1 Tax=Marchantia polymorpha subsp. ruderalis TaxID=1480154 RepID=A0A176WCB2_MARPO|nr:hypothetical protein AXG93_3884s1520 [Marchantia polymorpha subsp. ruderalis]
MGLAWPSGAHQDDCRRACRDSEIVNGRHQLTSSRRGAPGGMHGVRGHSRNQNSGCKELKQQQQKRVWRVIWANSHGSSAELRGSAQAVGESLCCKFSSTLWSHALLVDDIHLSSWHPGWFPMRAKTTVNIMRGRSSEWNLIPPFRIRVRLRELSPQTIPLQAEISTGCGLWGAYKHGGPPAGLGKFLGNGKPGIDKSR